MFQRLCNLPTLALIGANCLVLPLQLIHSIPTIPKASEDTLDKVQTIIDQGTKNITIAMVQALANSLQQQKNTGQPISIPHFTSAYINPNLDRELTQADPKVKAIYYELVRNTQRFIYQHSKDVLLPLINQIKTQNNHTDTSERLIGSFALPEAKRIVSLLQKEQPDILNHPELWVTY